MKMYNVTLEPVKIQCASRVFRFEPKKSVEVPNELIPFMEEQGKELGVFTLRDGMSKEEAKNAALEALRNYLNGALRTRISNYYRYTDEMKKKGISLQPDVQFARALRWDKEIRDLLKIEQKVEKELSYENEKDNLEFANIGNPFDGKPEIVEPTITDEELSDVVDVAPKKKVGRPPREVNDVNA